MKFINVLQKNPDLNEVIQVFKNPNADPEIIAKAGERFLLKLYSYINVKSKKSIGICDNSQVPSQDSDEEEETETVFVQTYDEIENEEDCYETDNPIADDVEEISVCDVLVGTKDDELATPGSSRTAKRRKMR
ncbi:hypothetical protein ILUMI_23630 [Ignelater luminosus]|uniref:Uncharacterized protein n=1 Tax=Ignelater luminosus TaxID=2038154 RepID=A0A8K0FZH4_IGNLU|nr:hypothetical protein ILUMI_23630 [Ignelater luminosus]